MTDEYTHSDVRRISAGCRNEHPPTEAQDLESRYPELRPLMTVRAAAAFLSLSERKVRDLIARGDISVTRWGRALRIPRHVLLQHIQTGDLGPDGPNGQPEVPDEL